MKNRLLILSFLFFLTQNVSAQKFSGGNGIGYSTETVLNLILPVELLYFSASIQDKTVQLAWETLGEKNNALFIVQKSLDGKNWSELGKVLGKGSTSEEQIYSFIDENPVGGSQFYRLKQVDFDGAASFSNMETITFERGIVFEIFPNPVADQLTVKWNLPYEKMTLDIVNAKGEMVFKENFNKLQEIELNVAHLPAGIYYLTIKTEGNVQHLNFVVY